MQKRAVITGLGVIAPGGTGKLKFWDMLSSGKSGIKKIEVFDPSPFPTQIAGEIADFLPDYYMDPKQSRRMDRCSQFGVACAKMALEDAKLIIEKENPERIAVITGTAIGGQEWAFKNYDIYKERGYKKANPFTAVSTFPNATSSQISLELKVKGSSDTISSGCSSSSFAIGYALDTIRNDRAEVVITGGMDAPLNPAIFGAFCLARVMTTHNEIPVKSPAPFDKNRDGIVLSEGGGVLIIEELSHALARGAHIYAEVLGWSSTCDSYHMISREPYGTQVARAIKESIKNSNLDPKNIDYIKAHGAGEVIGDRIETKVIKDIFKEKAKQIPASSIKGAIGHTQGACGTIETIATVLAMENSLIPPTINLLTPDPDCDLDYVPNKARKAKINKALINTVGFGGKNVALVIARYAD